MKRLFLGLGALLMATPSLAAITVVNDAASLQSALNTAGSGDVILFANNIAANVTASRGNIIISGSGYTLTPASSGLPTLILNAPGITVENVVISGNNTGFGIELEAGSDATTVNDVTFTGNNAAIFINSADGATNLKILNDFFGQNSVGISFSFSGTSHNTLINSSSFQANGYGIFANSSAAINDVKIISTTFEANVTGIHDFAGSNENWSIRSSRIEDNTQNGIMLFPKNLNGFTIDNTVFDHNTTNGLAIISTPGSTFKNIQIFGSAFSNNVGNGILLENNSSAISNVVIICNTFTTNTVAGLDAVGAQTSSLTVSGNSFSGNTAAGIDNEVLSTLDASQNYWGSPTGPTDPGNPGGAGDKALGLVTFVPFQTALQCVNTAPTHNPPCSTPTPAPVILN